MASCWDGWKEARDGCRRIEYGLTMGRDRCDTKEERPFCSVSLVKHIQGDFSDLVCIVLIRSVYGRVPVALKCGIVIVVCSRVDQDYKQSTIASGASEI